MICFEEKILQSVDKDAQNLQSEENIDDNGGGGKIYHDIYVSCNATPEDEAMNVIIFQVCFTFHL